MKAPQTVLFLTNSELGQASVVLAVAHEFLSKPGYNVHIASFSALQKDVSELNYEAARISGGSAGFAKFHTIAGKSMKEAAGRSTEFLEMHPPGLHGAVYAYDNVLPATFAPWEGSQYMIGYRSCLEIIRQVNPDIVAVDPLLSQGVDACNSLGVKCTILSPNTFKELVLDKQPKGQALWKFPAMASGFPYPLPWYYILLNFFLIFRFLRSRRTNPRLTALAKYRADCGIEGKIPCMFEGFGKHHILLPSTKAIDLDFHVPAHVHSCGPILRPSAPLAKTDLELHDWLAQGPTVLVNLGSHVLFDAAFARQFATGLKMLLNRRSDIQILWKLKTQGQTEEELYGYGGALEVIAAEIGSRRVRIESWLNAAPIAILESGYVVCMVHHGGSNSYHEAISAGVPQIVLPVWVDTYDFALRVEHLGIGAWGSRTAAPKVEGWELGATLVHVVDSANSNEMRAKAKALSEPFKKREGRVVAFEKIVELLDS